jgi:hypothetical protein
MYSIETPHGLFQYQDETHTYTLNGSKLDNNTSILQSVGITDFSGVPPETLEKARIRGKAVHAAIHYLEEGTLEYETLHPVVRNHVDQYLKFKEMTEWKPEILERPIFSKLIGYGTTTDQIGKMKERWSILEIKTGTNILHAAKIQTAGQLLAIQECLYMLPNVPPNPDRLVLELHEEKWKLHGPFLNTEQHIAVFRSAIWLNNYKKGVIK